MERIPLLHEYEPYALGILSYRLPQGTKYIYIYVCIYVYIGFPGSSVVNKTSAYAGNAVSILGLANSPGEGNGNTYVYTSVLYIHIIIVVV